MCIWGSLPGLSFLSAFALVDLPGLVEGFETEMTGTGSPSTKPENTETQPRARCWFVWSRIPRNEIADRLGVGIETVRMHCHNIYEKLQVSSRSEAVVKFLGK